MNCNLPFFVRSYFKLMDEHPEHFCKWQFKLRDNIILPAFEFEELTVYEERAKKYFGLSKYLGLKLFEWEEFVLGLHLCVYRADGLPRWPDLVCLIGRGAGKDGVISIESMALASPYNPVSRYNVDICANNEDQATRPVKDLYDAFENKKNVLSKFYKWTKESVTGLKQNSVIHGHTNNAKGKDGLRSGVVIFNEYHAYENYENINVFTTGLGKVDEPRRSIFTTNGDVVDGPLDELLKDCYDILNGDYPDNGMLPFLCCLDSKEEVDDEENWHKANPSLMYRPSLMDEIRKEYVEWKKNPARLPAFMTKRMNIRETSSLITVTSWENIKATNKKIPNLTGYECIVGIDFATTNDWIGVDAHFKCDDNRYDINHAWVCKQSYDFPRLKPPLGEWELNGHISIIDEPEIDPRIIMEYISTLQKKYYVKAVALDNYRFALMREYLEVIGFSIENKNIILVRPSDIMKVYPIIDRCFTNQYFHWDDNPCLRWATNNVKLVRAKKSVLSATGEADTGNFMFGKIERCTRKTDPFMALVAAMCGESRLSNMVAPGSRRKRVRVRVY